MLRNPKGLIALVGHNPLPIYISIAALQPQVVHWIYSQDTAKCKDDLIKVIEKHWRNIVHEDKYYLNDPHSPRSVQETMSRLPQGAVLNYTGGTKVMTTHAHMYWMNHLGGKADHSLYVDGKNGFFRLDSGEDLDIDRYGVSISVNDVISIHGLDVQKQKAKTMETAGIRSEHWNGLARWAVNCSKPDEEIKKLYNLCQQMREKPGKAKEQPLDLSPLLREYLPGFATADNWPTGNVNNTVKAWGTFLTGGWLEHFTEELLNNVRQVYNLGFTVASGVKPETRELKHGGDSELDVLAVQGYRVYLLSCTTSTREGRIKEKCYEALNRVELVGGELAKAAIISLAEPQKAYNAEQKARIGWKGDEGTVKVFNREDIRSWLDGDYSSLMNWLI